MATRGNLTSVPPPTPEQERSPDLRDAVREALAKMTWLGPTDAGVMALAQRQAEEIEKAVERADMYAELLRDSSGDMSVYKRLQKLEAMCDLTKTVGWLGPQLQGVLRDLGGTPRVRAELGAEKKAGGRLAQLRAAAAGEDDS
jgi:hypothetical protein